MDIPPLPPLPERPAPTPASNPEERAMREAAQEFEATFLAEMLKQTGINATPDGYGGGAGEDAFSGLLTQEYARAIAERGGIGLAEHIFESLKQRNTDQ